MESDYGDASIQTKNSLGIMTNLPTVNNTIIGRSASGEISALSPTAARTVLNIENGSTKSEFFVGTFTRDTTLASGTQSITGVGFQPSALIFFMGGGDTTINSKGFTDGASDFCIAEGASQGQPADAIYFDQGVGSYVGRIDSSSGSLDSDGFTVDWLRVSAPTLTLTIQYLAIR